MAGRLNFGELRAGFSVGPSAVSSQWGRRQGEGRSNGRGEPASEGHPRYPFGKFRSMTFSGAIIPSRGTLAGMDKLAAGRHRTCARLALVPRHPVNGRQIELGKVQVLEVRIRTRDQQAEKTGGRRFERKV